MSDYTRISLKTGIVSSFKDIAISKIDDVPIGNASAVKELFGDNTRFEFVNTVMLGEKYPAKPDAWTKLILTEEWANTFVKVLKTSPKPLYVPGHADSAIHPKERAIPDGYIIGGLVSNNVLYLRNALPEGKSEVKKELIDQTIREIKAKMLATSTSDYMKYTTKIDEEANEVIYYAIESVGNQSNALVEADMTGSEAEIILTSFKHDESTRKGEHNMGDTITTKEMFVSLKNQIDSGHLALDEVAKSLGITVMTENQRTALKRLNDAESKVGNITDFVDKTVAEKDAIFASLKEEKIKAKFKDEGLVELATSFFSLKKGTVEEIDAELDKIAGMKVFKSIQGKLVSDMNADPGAGGESVSEENADTMEA